MAIDTAKLDAFMGRAVGDIGAAMSAVLVLIGDRLGLYKSMAAAGRAGVTPAELAARTSTTERYIREWLLNQAAGGYIEYDRASGKYWIPEEQAMALAEEGSPAFVQGAFQVIYSAFMDEGKIEKAFRTGEGLDWGEHHHCLFDGTERFFRPGYEANLVSSWIPALEGVEARLGKGATVADVGCGHGASTIVLAKAYPNSTFIGFDSHGPSIEAAWRAAARAGVNGNLSFEAASSTDFHAAPGGGTYDLVTCFDCLHDMGDPVGAARHTRSRLKSDGTWMIVEPFANDTIEDNLNPVGRVFSAASTMICVPASLAHRGPALGAQAGQKRLAEVVAGGGFSRFRRATQTPFNLVLEARP